MSGEILISVSSKLDIIITFYILFSAFFYNKLNFELT